MGMFGYTSFWPFFGIGLLFKILFWILLIWLFVKLIQSFSSGSSDHEMENIEDKSRQSSESALNILKMRYAKGEITKKEFDAMKKDIA